MGQAKIITRRVVLRGLRPIMFDRYPGDNKTKLPAPDKLYLDGKAVVLPAENVMSFLTAINTTSAPKRLLDKREYQTVCNACQCFVEIGEDPIPFLRDGKPVQVGTFGADGRDERSGIFTDHRVARVKGGVPNPKSRPVLPLPWELRFTLRLFPNKEVGEPTLRNLFEDGGLVLGFGTFRGRYGKFEVASWD